MTKKVIYKSQKISALVLTRLTRTLYFFIGFFALSIVIFDSGNLLTKEDIVKRWTILTVLFFFNTIVWFISSQTKSLSKSALTIMIGLALLAFAGFMTYWERGMASTSTILYILPILVVATLKNRHALLAMGALGSATYAFSAVKYFNDYFNEGLRIQLWGSIVLYSGAFLVCTWLIMILTDLRHDSR